MPQNNNGAVRMEKPTLPFWGLLVALVTAILRLLRPAGDDELGADRDQDRDSCREEDH